MKKWARVRICRKNLASEWQIWNWGKKELKATQIFQIEVYREAEGRDPVILCAISKSETSINVKQPNQWLVEPLFFGWALDRGKTGPRPTFHWSPTMPLCWPLYVVGRLQTQRLADIPSCWLGLKKKRALLLPWVIPGQASQEYPVGGLCSKGASCSQLKVPSHCKHTSVHLPRPNQVQPPLQEVHRGLSDLNNQ